MKRELRRCIEGVWFYNFNRVIGKVKPTYITGDNYWFLTHFPYIGVGITQPGMSPYYFREYQRRDFIHWRACELDPRCHGSIKLKSRREGFTLTTNAIMLKRLVLPYKGFYNKKWV